MKRIQLEYFLCVANEKSYTKAAKKLYISQPALSKSIQTIEKELDVTLFKRDSRELVLTEDGEAVYRYADDILRYWDTRTAELMSQLKKSRGTLRFGLPPSVGNIFFSKVIHRYKSQFPQVDLQIFEGTSKEIETMVTEDEIDVGVVVEPYENPKMDLKTVYRSEVVLAVSPEHRLAGRETVDFIELKDEPMLLVSDGYMFHDQVIEHCRMAGFTPNITFRALQWDLLLEMAAENQGITLIGRPLVEKLYRNRLVCSSLANPAFPWVLGIISKKGMNHAEPIRSFLDFCSSI